MRHYAFADREFGRIWARSLLAQTLFYISSQPVKWNQNDWEGMLHNLAAVRRACVRTDRNVAVLHHDTAEDPTPDERVLHWKCFNEDLKRIQNACHVNQAVAPIRRRIEKQIKKWTTGPAAIKHEDVVAVL